ncbi:hypothetical protein Q3G72_026743 [Acer saccharum]|nr:hypothetical protein Q3G72_026743 [Acer saccharum]
MGLGDDLMKDVSDLVEDLDERSDLGSLEVKRGRFCTAPVQRHFSDLEFIFWALYVGRFVQRHFSNVAASGLGAVRRAPL